GQGGGARGQGRAGGPHPDRGLGHRGRDPRRLSAPAAGAIAHARSRPGYGEPERALRARSAFLMPAPSRTSPAGRMPGLDGLRGLAALAVVVLHVWMYTEA